VAIIIIIIIIILYPWVYSFQGFISKKVKIKAIVTIGPERRRGEHVLYLQVNSHSIFL